MHEKNNIDQIKALLVMLVIIGHAIQYNYINFDQNYLFKFIYMFHMPLFAFISGYLQNVNSLDKVVKYGKILLIPFVTWGLILNYNQSENILDIVIFLLKESDNSLWYLLVIYQCMIIEYIIKDINKNLLLYLSGVIFSYLIILFTHFFIKFDYFGIKQLIFIYPFYFIGRISFLYLKRIKWFIEKYLHLLVINSIMLIIIFIFIWERQYHDYYGYTRLLDEKFKLFEFYLMKMIAPVPFIILTIIFLLFVKTKKYTLVKQISNETLSFYALQFVIINFYVKYFSNYLENFMLNIIYCTIFTFFTVSLLIVLLNKNSILKKLLCGR